MPDKPLDIFNLLFGGDYERRFTQDSPVLPEVWMEYFRGPEPKAVDLLFNPYRGQAPGELRQALLERVKMERGWELFAELPTGLLPAERGGWWRPKPMVFNESHLVGELWFDELIRAALPLTRWWSEYVWRPAATKPERIGPELVDAVEMALSNPREHVFQVTDEKGKPSGKVYFSEDFVWLVEVTGRYVQRYGGQTKLATRRDLLRWGLQFMQNMPLPAEIQAWYRDFSAATKPQSSAEPLPETPYLLWSVSRNREAVPAVWKSCPAVKADAAKQLFSISSNGLRWAIVDSGVDATHPAFRKRKKGKELENERDANGILQSRVTQTYDLTKLRTLLDPDGSSSEVWIEGVHFSREARARAKAVRATLEEVKERLGRGQLLHWEDLEPHLRVAHDATYPPPQDGHGTHVAGILAADWRPDDAKLPPSEIEKGRALEGMCPDIQICDLRVLDEGGRGTDFEVMAALQLIRYMNANKDQPLVHGVNLSLSIPSEVSSFACGRTPVCEECERLVGSGVVVVAAAGNRGYSKAAAALGLAEFQDISVTDPGNAEGVITVGATHRNMPHTYGVSYFSSRGPTGDGRAKPDLVAPGEKIKSTLPGGLAGSLDGTSMAAPHVSGAAALLMSRHTELIGQPARIKRILCDTATDLGRTRDFQGAGMVDILRAIQSL